MEDERILEVSICEEMATKIPEHCGVLGDYTKDIPKFYDRWDDYFRENGVTRKEIRNDIRECMEDFLSDADEKETNHTIKRLSGATRRYLSDPKNMRILNRQRFRQGEFTRFPNNLISASAFFARSKREGNFITIPPEEGITRQYGPTIVTYSGFLLFSDPDAITLATLMQLRSETKLFRAGNGIAFNTSLYELCKRSGNERPTEYIQHESMRRSLKRLALLSVSFSKVDPTSHSTLAMHVLNKLVISDDGTQVLIVFNTEFVKMEEKNYTLLNHTKLLRVKNETSPIGMCLFLFLSRQRALQHQGNYKIGLRKLADLAGLRPEGKYPKVIERQVTKGLEELKHGFFLVRHYKITGEGDKRMVSIKGI